MSIELLLSAPKHPAREAAIRSVKTAVAKDKEGWLANFTEDAVIQDPVGPSPMDPEGNGHKGPKARETFYDTYIANGALRFEIRKTIACGNECVNIGTIITKTDDGHAGWTELVMHYIVNDEGKLTQLRAYWEFDRMVETIF